MNQVKKISKIALGIPLTLLSFFFIGKIIFDSWPKISDRLESANWHLLIIGLFFMLGFFLIRAIAWGKIVNLFSESDRSPTESIYLYSLAETKRYIPGNIFSFVSRVEKFNSDNFSKRTVIKALALESIFMVLSAIFISLPEIKYLIYRENLTLFFPIGLAVVIITVLLIVFFRKRIKKIYETKISNILPRKSFFSYLDIFSISSLAWGFFALANFLFASALFPNDPNLIIIISSIFTLAWLTGYLSFVAPMGLGIREAAVIYLLSPFIPIYAASAIAIFTRIMMIISEIIFLFISLSLHKFSQKLSKLNKILPIIIVALTAILYISYFSFFSITKHSNFFTGKFDLGNMEQTVWNTTQGRIFMFSNPDGATELSRLSAHSDFILLFFTPVYALYPSANLLLIIQTLVIGLGGFFVFLLSLQILKSKKLAVILSISYYLNYFIQEQNLFDFHAVSLATTFLLGAFYFLVVKRYALFGLMLGLAVLTKENVFLISSLFGGFIFLKGKRIYGSLLFIVSIIIFIFLMSYAIPYARGGNHFAIEYLAYLGNSPFEIILSPILKPDVFFSVLFSVKTFDYLYITFLPLGFLSLLSPLYIIFMLPDLFINIFSDNPNLQSYQYHYGALTVPFVYISAIYGIKLIIKKVKSPSISNIIFYYLIAISIFTTYNYSPLIGMENADDSAFKKIEGKEEVINAISNISPEKSVSATNNIAAHLVQREKIYVYPYGSEFADYLVFYKNDLEEAREITLYDDSYRVTFDDYELLILRKVNPLYKVDKP